MNKFGTALLSATALVASGTALAAEPQWDYVQLGWIQGDGRDDDGKAEGFEIKGSFSFLENLHVQLSYADGDIAGFDGGNDADFDGYTLTFGYHLPITANGNTHFFTDISYFDFDFDSNSGSGDNKGWGLGAGVRSVLADRVELLGKLSYNRGDADFAGIDDDYTNTEVKVGARYLWTENLSTGLTVTMNDLLAEQAADGGDSAVIDVRWAFGPLMR